MPIKKKTPCKENNLASEIKSISRLKPDKVLFCCTELRFLHSVTKYKKTLNLLPIPYKTHFRQHQSTVKILKTKAKLLMSQIIRSRFKSLPKTKARPVGRNTT